jgi:hypothetical protein
MKTRKRKIKSKSPSVSKQVASLVEAFECAVTLGVNEGEFARPYCRLSPDTQYKLRTACQCRLAEAWQRVGDITTLLSDWPALNDAEPVSFYGTCGLSALEVVYRFTQKLVDGPVAFLPQYPEGWTQPKIREEKEALLARLRIELARCQTGPVSKWAGLIYEKLMSLPKHQGMDTTVSFRRVCVKRFC